MIQVYILIATICIVCLFNYYIFNSFYTEFDEKFRSTMVEVKQGMIDVSREMEELFKDMIMKGDEPEDLVEFGKAWRDRLQVLHGLEVERSKMNGHIMVPYYLLIFSLAFAVFDLLSPGPILIIHNVAIYFHLFGWTFTGLAGIVILFNYRVYVNLMGSLKANQTVVIKVCSTDPVEDDVQVYKIHTVQDDPIPAEQ